MSGGFLFYLIKVKKQPFFLIATKDRGWLRPKPLHTYHLIVFTYMFFEGLHLIFLVNELYPNLIAAEVGNIMADSISAASAAFYPVSIVYSTPNIQLDKQHENSYFRNFNYVGPNARLVDIVGIILFFVPLFTLLPFASLAGYYAEMNDVKMENVFYTAHYFAWVAWEIIYITVLTFYWYRLTFIIKDHIKVLLLEKDNSNQVKKFKRGTRNLTIPVLAIVFGLLLQAIIYVVMSLTHRSNTVYYFGWNLFYYWIGYVTFPLLGFGIECSVGFSSPSSSQGQLNTITTVNMESQKDSKTLCCLPIKNFGITTNKPTITVIHCSSETITIVENNNEQSNTLN
ncbi:1426_t:CDS:2 [Funneliformis mosseae]|uniref:1426_t:CDS:1 n=1 Tax=Funneliformis mosseae TaxID=27381 RepID=A0A9N9HNV1_FUNMO|nr:1426_t:CDS:2 [Funneliformis mosseae]